MADLNPIIRSVIRSTPRAGIEKPVVREPARGTRNLLMGTQQTTILPDQRDYLLKIE